MKKTPYKKTGDIGDKREQYQDEDRSHSPSEKGRCQGKVGKKKFRRHIRTRWATEEKTIGNSIPTYQEGKDGRGER